MEALACVMWTVVLLPCTLGLNTTDSPADITSIDFHVTPNITDFKEASTHTPAARRISDPNEIADTSQASSPDTSPSLIPLRRSTITSGSPLTSASATSTNLNEDRQAQSAVVASEIIPTIPVLPASTLKVSITGSASLEKVPRDGPSELDVGDEESAKMPSPSPLDPLFAGLISIFIISTALLFTMLFLRFRQQSRHPEFHRLHDLPMDDLLEDTPLSRYAY